MTNREVSWAEAHLAAVIRVRADKALGRETPSWIVTLAER